MAMALRERPITIIGAGAIGGTVGAFLHDAGYDVTLVDAAEEHVRAINEAGLRLTGIRGERTFPVRAILPGALRGPLGVVFLCVKGHYTEAAMAQYGRHLAPDGYVVSLQNGLNEPTIARHVGPARTVGAFVHFGADLIEPGLIQLGNEQTIYIGELDGRITARAEAVAAALARVMPTAVTDNLWGFLWGKLVYGAVAFAVSCVDAPIHAVLDDPLGRAVSHAAAAEAYRVASAQVARLEQIGGFDPNSFAPGSDFAARADATLAALADGTRGAVKQHMGIWRDLRVKRRKTEVDVLTGVIVAGGRERGIATPVNAAILDLIHAIEAGRAGMGWENLRAIAARSGLGTPA